MTAWDFFDTHWSSICVMAALADASLFLLVTTSLAMKVKMAKITAGQHEVP